jgi:adenylate kinase
MELRKYFSRVITIIAAPGRGKDTVAKYYAEKTAELEHFKINVLSSGDAVRAAIKNVNAEGIELKVQNIVKALPPEALVPDKEILELTYYTLNKNVLSGAYAQDSLLILNGVPRSKMQVNYIACDDIFRISGVLHLSVSDDLKEEEETLVARAIHRRNLAIGKGEQPRRDDDPDIIKRRLKIYHETTAPILDIYKNKFKIPVIDIHNNKSKEDLYKTLDNIDLLNF